MKLLEDKIKEYKTNFKFNEREILDSNCTLTGQEVIEIEELSHLAHLYMKNLLGAEIKENFLNRVQMAYSNLKTNDLIQELISIYNS